MQGERLREMVKRLRQTLGAEPGNEVADADLVRRWRKHKDQAAFELLVWRHAPMMLGVCQRLLNDEHAAQDAVQAAFLILVKKAGSIRRPEALASWLYRVAYRAALQCLAARKRQPVSNERAVQAALCPPPHGPIWQELSLVLDEEVDRLPEKYRAAFVLCQMQGRTNQEAARALGCPVGTIVSRLSRARERLRGRLRRRGVILSSTALATVVAAHAVSANASAMLVPSIVQSSGLFLAGGAASTAISPQVAGLARGLMHMMLITKLRTAALILMVLVAGTGIGTGLAFHLGGGEQGDARTSQPDRQRQTDGAKASHPPQNRLAAFDRLSPQARWRAIHKLPDTDKAFQPAVRGGLAPTLVERGAIESAKSISVVSPLTSTVTWLAEEGARVKKGDKLVELADSGLQARLDAEKKVLQKAQTEARRAAENLAFLVHNKKLDMRGAEIDVRLAELEVKKYRGNDSLEKQALELRVERARLELERARFAVAAAEQQAGTEVERTREELRDVRNQLLKIERQIQQCRMYAPQDGVVTCVLSGFPRRRTTPGTEVAQGQELLQVSDPKHLNVVARIPEAVIFRVRAGQKATVHVDAFPGKVFQARVEQVATTASPNEWRAKGVKLYPVQLSLLDGPRDRLLPTMSAEVRINVESVKNVLHIPLQALVQEGGKSFCYVKVGQEIQKREVTTALRNDRVAEVRTGVSEGEAVLRHPRTILRELRALDVDKESR